MCCAAARQTAWSRVGRVAALASGCLDWEGFNGETLHVCQANCVSGCCEGFGWEDISQSFRRMEVSFIQEQPAEAPGTFFCFFSYIDRVE